MGTFSATRLASARGLASRARARHGHRRPRVAFLAGHGDANLGDEVMLSAARSLLSPAVLVDVTYPNHERLLRRIGLSGPSYFDALVLGGGTLINPFFASRLAGVFDPGTPSWMLGTGVGSTGFAMEPQVDIAEWDTWLPQFVGLGLRGPLSVGRLRARGHAATDIGDLALAVTPETSPATAQPTVAVNLARPDERITDDLAHGRIAEAFVSTARGLEERGFRVLPVAMHRNDLPGLERFNRELVRPANIAQPRTADEFMELVSGCAAMLAVRLHAAVLSACVGVPPAMLAYRDKTDDFAASLDLGSLVIDPRNPGLISVVAQRAIDTGTSEREAIWHRALERRRRIERYAEGIRARLFS